MMQLFLDAFLSDDLSGVFGNLAKLGLSLLAMGFDILFIFQHYVWYRGKDKVRDGENQPILSSTSEE
jgi:cystinosin